MKKVFKYNNEKIVIPRDELYVHSVDVTETIHEYGLKNLIRIVIEDNDDMVTLIFKGNIEDR